MKFKKGFVAEYEDKLQDEQNQDELRKKHGIEDENVRVVEKSSLIKFLIRTLGRIIRVMASIVFVLLVAVGVIALIYPQPRAAVWEVGQEIYLQVMDFVGLDLG